MSAISIGSYDKTGAGNICRTIPVLSIRSLGGCQSVEVVTSSNVHVKVQILEKEFVDIELLKILLKLFKAACSRMGSEEPFSFFSNNDNSFV